jgi:hypothetical protein
VRHRPPAAGSIPSQVLGKRVAFQVDHIDEALSRGWSVLMRGRAWDVTDPDVVRRLRDRAYSALGGRAVDATCGSASMQSRSPAVRSRRVPWPAGERCPAPTDGSCAGLGRMEARVVGVDVGSVALGRFAWAALDAPALSVAGQGADPESAVQALIPGLASGGRAALVLEAPMSVPVPASDRADGWEALGRARAGEGNRPWSAGAGAGVLATGLAQAAWMLARLVDTVPGTTVTTRPARWATPHGPKLLLAEALVSGAGKPVPTASGPHAADAEAAARALAERLPEPSLLASDVRCAPHRPFNLLAAAAMWAGLNILHDELHADVLVLRAGSPRPQGG